MKITNEFTVSAPAEQAWDVLTDLEHVVPLMPGAQLVGQEGDDYLGKVKVKVGPVTSEFSGKAHFVERDGEARRAVVDARGREAARDRKRGRHHHLRRARGRGPQQGHGRHRPQDRRQTRPVRQRHVAAGFGEAAGRVRRLAGGQAGRRQRGSSRGTDGAPNGQTKGRCRSLRRSTYRAGGWQRDQEVRPGGSRCFPVAAVVFMLGASRATER